MPDAPGPESGCPPRAASRATPDRTLVGPLLAVAASSALVAAFATLAGRVVAGDTHAFDEALVHGARALRAAYPWFAHAMRDLSALGSTAVLTLVVVLATGYLVLAGRTRLGVIVALSAIGGATGVSVLKAVFGRARPDGRLAESVVEGLSFPSGHATMSAAIYLTLGALLASTRARRRERAWLLGAAAAIAALVGASRVVLGVHWATDVLGGWAFGAAWAIAWLLLARAAAR